MQITGSTARRAYLKSSSSELFMDNREKYLAQQLYLNLACKPFTLILGTSRVDMTAFTRRFAAHFGATAENGRYLQLQVRPDFMDSSDLFGWLNLEGKFIPGAIMDFLKTAHSNPEENYFLCLDRIILSRAEYYLRDILNAVDLRFEPDAVPYVPAIYYGRDEGAMEKYGVIPVLPNLYMMGTVNLDETSLPLNQRFLDRVHTMTLTEEDVLQISPSIPKELKTTYYRLDQWQGQQVVDDYIRAFERINQILIKATSYLGFKIRNEGILYLLHNRKSGLLPEKVAMDQVLCQKVLPRLQGNAKLMCPVLSEFLAYCEEQGYTQTAGKAAAMLRSCEENGYCSCWE